MKKIILSLLCLLITAGSVNAVSPTFSNPTAGTMDFYPLMQHQFEKEETFDFVNRSEDYKVNRSRKEAQDAYRAGNKNFNPSYGSHGSFLNFKRKKSNMEFSTDTNGNIIIKDSKDKK